jgi:hypothetical protein
MMLHPRAKPKGLDGPGLAERIAQCFDRLKIRRGIEGEFIKIAGMKNLVYF